MEMAMESKISMNLHITKYTWINVYALYKNSVVLLSELAKAIFMLTLDAYPDISSIAPVET